MIINKLYGKIILKFYNSSDASEEFRKALDMLEKKSMVLEISDIVNEAKTNLAKEINKSITYVYWNIGRIIVKHENEENIEEWRNLEAHRLSQKAG